MEAPVVELRPHPSKLGVDHVHRGNADLHERHVVVGDAHVGLEEVVPVAELCRRLRHDILEPAGGLRLARHVEILVPDHVEQEEALDARHCSGVSRPGGSVADQ